MEMDPPHVSASENSQRFDWRAHPARERPLATLIACAVIALVAMAIVPMAGVWWGVLAVVVLVLSLHRFFFPSTFSIEPETIVAHDLFRTRRYAWKEIRRFTCDQHGAFLSTRSRPSPLDAFRGMHLLFGSVHDEVIRRIRQRLASQEGLK